MGATMFTKTSKRTITRLARERKAQAAKTFDEMTTGELIHYFNTQKNTGQRNAFDACETLRKRGVLV